ncbi:hypothetical protein E4H04_10430 [Candidatus Bathyarchaeota archaeon]|nr:MAG: hypothetical protein E4H04_10430 [Candidatus Bathyarchaeota archaeon]
MNLRIVPYTLILLLFVSPTVMQVKAQGNMTLPTNTTLVNTTLTNTTQVNGTLTNSTSPDTNGTSMQLSAEALADFRLMAENCLTEMMQLFGDAPLSPEVANGLSHAQQAMMQAMMFEENGNPAAAQQYLRAMKHHRNTLREYLKENPQVEEELEQIEVNGTAIDDVNGTVTEAMISAAQMQLINQFEERFQEQIRAMIMNVNELSEDMDPEDALKAQRALEKAETKLLRIQERIQSGQYMEALDELENATETLEEDFDGTDPGTAQMLRTMNKLEAKIQKLEQKAARKAAKGLSTTEEDALMAELRGNKDHTKHEFKTYGKGKPVKDKEKSNNGKNKL